MSETALSSGGRGRIVPIERGARLAGFGQWLLLVAILLFFAVSPQVLFVLGLNYEAPGGSALHKVHPGTFVLMAAVLAIALARGNPIGFGAAFLARTPETMPYLFGCGLLLWHIVGVQKVPFTPVIDTFLMPVLLLAAVRSCDATTRSRLGRLLHLLMGLNALVALAEFLTGWRLTPYYAGTVLITDDWRSTALLGHPLGNAAVTGVYVLLLVAGGGGLTPARRSAMLALQMAAVVSFGGRAALVVLLAVLALLAVAGLVRVLRGGRIDLRQAAAAAAILPLLAVLGGALFEAGFFDRLLTRFVSDGGSAGTRLAMFRLFEVVPLKDLLIGPDPAVIETYKIVEGLEFGIESFWVGFVLNYGLIVSLIFFAGLGAFCAALVRIAGPGAVLPLLFFFVVASTSVSISAKSVVLGQITALVLILLSREPAQRMRQAATEIGTWIVPIRDRRGTTGR